MEKKIKKETLESEEISNKTEKETRRNKGRKKGRERDSKRNEEKWGYKIIQGGADKTEGKRSYSLNMAKTGFST